MCLFFRGKKVLDGLLFLLWWGARRGHGGAGGSAAQVSRIEHEEIEEYNYSGQPRLVQPATLRHAHTAM
jgi:hypothetical protein